MKHLPKFVCLLAMICICTASWALDSDDPALVGLWLCDEGSGDTIGDSSVNANDATGTFDWAEGKFGDGLLISTGAITVPTSDSIDSVTDGLTIAAWFRVDATSDTGIRRQNGYLLEDQSDSEPVPDGFSFRIWTTNGLSPGVYGKTELKQGEWYHVAGTYDGAIMKLYVNGEEETELLDSTGGDISGEWSGDVGTPADELQLKYGAESYTGAMDEIILFSRALSDDEIMALTGGWDAAQPVNSQDKLSATWGAIKCLER